MSERRTPAEIAFDQLVAELREAIEESGAYADVLELGDLEFLQWAIDWTNERRERFDELEESEQALVVALMRLRGEQA